jgi:phosphoglycerate dehydrogenase-like enzyme
MTPRRFLIWMHAPDVPQWSIPAESVERIRAALGDEWEVRTVDEPMSATGDGAPTAPAELLERIGEAEVFCGFGIRREPFLAGRRLRWVHSAAAGVGASLFDEMRDSDVLFTNSGGIYAEPMAEHALAMILYFSRGLDIAAAARAERRWEHARLAGVHSPLHELSGRVLGIVGYGRIGSALGRRASVLGMRVRAIRRTLGGLPLPPELERLDGPEGLPELLRECDFVAITVPETPETTQLIGAQQLALMRTGTVLLNLSRGSILDEQALLQALTERRLRGAALDVFQLEPLPADHPFWALENVLVTPHVSGTSGRFWERQTDLIVRNIRRYLAGEELENQVDKERGY